MDFLSQTLTIRRTAGKGGRGPYLFPSISFTRSGKLIYFQFSIWADYLLFLIAAHVIIRLLLEEIYLPLKIRIWLNISYIYFTSWFYVRSYYSNFPQGKGAFELASNIIPPLQSKPLTKWASHPRATHICDWKWRQIWIILMSYTSVNSNKFFSRVQSP